MLKVNVGMWNKNDDQTQKIDDERQTRMLNDDGVEKQSRWTCLCV